MTTPTQLHFDNIQQVTSVAAQFWDGFDAGDYIEYTYDLKEVESKFSIKQAIECGTTGGYWPEGANKIKPVNLDLSGILAESIKMPRPAQHMAGYRPNVPAYLAGNPVNMWRQEPHPLPNRLLKIGVHVGKAYPIEQETTFYRGTAILSIVDALTMAGFNVELTAVWRNKSANGGQVNIDTIIKRSDQSWSADSVAFALCNDGYQRRVIWPIINKLANENDQNAIKISDTLGSGDEEKGEDFDLFFPYLLDRWTVNNCIDKALAIIKPQLDKLKNKTV